VPELIPNPIQNIPVFWALEKNKFFLFQKLFFNEKKTFFAPPQKKSWPRASIIRHSKIQNSKEEGACSPQQQRKVSKKSKNPTQSTTENKLSDIHSHLTPSPAGRPPTNSNNRSIDH
jgi:hypothetical protein